MVYSFLMRSIYFTFITWLTALFFWLYDQAVLYLFTTLFLGFDFLLGVYTGGQPVNLYLFDIYVGQTSQPFWFCLFTLVTCCFFHCLFMYMSKTYIQYVAKMVGDCNMRLWGLMNSPTEVSVGKAINSVVNWGAIGFAGWLYLNTQTDCRIREDNADAYRPSEVAVKEVTDKAELRKKLLTSYREIPDITPQEVEKLTNKSMKEYDERLQKNSPPKKEPKRTVDLSIGPTGVKFTHERETLRRDEPIFSRLLGVAEVVVGKGSNATSNVNLGSALSPNDVPKAQNQSKVTIGVDPGYVWDTLTNLWGRKSEGASAPTTGSDSSVKSEGASVNAESASTSNVTGSDAQKTTTKPVVKLTADSSSSSVKE